MAKWEWKIENEEFLNKTTKRCKEKKIILPKFSELRNPETIPQHIVDKLKEIDINEIHPLNLFRINWQNDMMSGGIGEVNFLEIPAEITGVKARIIGLIGKFFPTGAHKVGATYGVLVPYLVTGKFNPEYHKAVWPSTGNYCRGGAFNSALLSVHAVAILPEEMSRERFEWLRSIGAEVYATPGCESNVKEIYDKCHELERTSDEYFIFNQFEQFGNSCFHYYVTGYAIEKVFEKIKKSNPRLSGFVSATGSAGTIGAGDYLKEKFPMLKIVASEALQCPTLLMNGYGGHRIEGIGDKHVPWIHNVKNTDVVVAINDEHPLRILRLFNEPEGLEFLSQLGVEDSLLKKLSYMGISSISNLISSIKLAKWFEMNENDVIFTVFTDSVEMYRSRLEEMNQTFGKYSKHQAEMDWESILQRQSIDYMKELNYYEKKTIHNLKYFTWIEQQGKSVNELNAQWYDEDYWKTRYQTVEQWDKLIEEFNQKVGMVD